MTGSVPFPIRVAVGAAFAVVLSVWTWLLLEPHPVSDEVKRSLASLSSILPFLLAKGLHATGYALLALLGCACLPTPRWRMAVLAFLLLHGVGTEIGQTFVPNRTGRVEDVLIDWGGIVAGWLVWRVVRRVL
jgi:VanZ family protein